MTEKSNQSHPWSLIRSLPPETDPPGFSRRDSERLSKGSLLIHNCGAIHDVYRAIFR
jgi:hypothetical protein